MLNSPLNQVPIHNPNHYLTTLFSELNTKKPPKIKGFTTFSKISKRNFHGIGVYVRNHLRGYVLRVPDEDEELEIVHIIIKKIPLQYATYLAAI